MIAVRRIGVIDPAAIRRQAAQAYPKNSHGRGRVPDYVVVAMHAEYMRLGTLAKVAPLFGRSKRALSVLFNSRGLAVNRRGFPTMKLSPKQDAIVRALEARRSLTLADAVQLVGGDIYANAERHVGAILARMIERGLIVRVRRGVYAKAAQPAGSKAKGWWE